MRAPAAEHGAPNGDPSGPRRAALVYRRLGGWTALGVVAGVGMVLTGTRIGSVPDPAHILWWLSLPSGGSPYVSIGFYAATVVFIAAWVGLGRQVFRGGLTQGQAWIVLVCWGLPFFLGPPLFSRDVYSYIGQGLLAHHGFDPYTVGPSALGPSPLLSSIASVWRSTTSPYGPLFVVSTRAVVAVSGSSLLVQVLMFRVLELIGVALVMVFLPRLARHLGTDPGVALWLGALSPLAMFSFISSGHNDALLVGLLVAGVTLAVEGRLAWGITLLALATTVKLPAAAAIVFVVVDRFRSPDGRRHPRVVVEAVGITAAVVVAVTLLDGFGWTWLGPTALHVPTELHVLQTPSVSLGVLVFRVLHGVGLPVTQHTMVEVAQDVVAVVAVAGVLWLLATVRRHEVVRSLGLALILIVVGSPTVWPWYLLWGLVLLAATGAQRSRILAAVAALAMLAVGPSGSPRLLGPAYAAVSLAVVATVVWLVRDRNWEKVVTGRAA